MSMGERRRDERRDEREVFSEAFVKPFVPRIKSINGSVEDVRKQQDALLSRVDAAKRELKWCTELGQLEATMDLIPHYTNKAQQCVRDMHQLAARVAKAKEKAMKLARAAEKGKGKT